MEGPLLRDRPVEHPGAGGHLAYGERDALADLVERRPEAVACDAAVVRQQRPHHVVHGGTGAGRLGGGGGPDRREGLDVGRHGGQTVNPRARP